MSTSEEEARDMSDDPSNESLLSDGDDGDDGALDEQLDDDDEEEEEEEEEEGEEDLPSTSQHYQHQAISQPTPRHHGPRPLVLQQHLQQAQQQQQQPPPQPQTQHANYYGPPFYGRPPTPMPPSPSLTSLVLRPSRPTTPDASADEDFEPVARAAPKVPTYEYYGFVLYLFSSLTFLMYLLWSYLPSPFLHALGIYYYPNRWWSLAIPAFLVMLLVYIYVALALYNTEILTLPLSSIETIVDDSAKVAVVDAKGRLREGTTTRRRERAPATTRLNGDKERGGAGAGAAAYVGDVDWRAVWSEGTDAVMDVPLAGVCEVLYRQERESDYDYEVDSDW